jgi:hypothetical protein
MRPAKLTGGLAYSLNQLDFTKPKRIYDDFALVVIIFWFSDQQNCFRRGQYFQKLALGPGDVNPLGHEAESSKGEMSRNVKAPVPIG